MLTDVVIRALKPGPKPYKKADRDGLYLYVTPAGSKLWRMKFRFAGREQRLAFGAYPEISLAAARTRCADARQQLRNKINPAAPEHAPTVDAPTVGQPAFEQVAREWHAKQCATWGERHASDVIECLEKDVFLAMGSLPLDTITAPLVYSVVHAIEARGAVETAHRTRQRISAVFVYGIARGLCGADPAATIRLAYPHHQRPQAGNRRAVPVAPTLAEAEAEPAHPATNLTLRSRPDRCSARRVARRSLDRVRSQAQ